jgi:hypothetical protein
MGTKADMLRPLLEFKFVSGDVCLDTQKGRHVNGQVVT